RYRIDTGYMLEVVTQRHVRHELYVARYHLLSDNFDAALHRCDDALKNYPGSGLAAEALVLKGETLLKAKRNDEARVVFEGVVRDHKGAFSIVAKRFLKHMATPSSAGS
ncbi:MAG: outer membrane protein assembly factor BamD, partial [Polyangiaceae bacterium]